MKLLIVANWKMNPATLKGAELLFEEIKNGVKDKGAEVVICPPFVYLSALRANGAQDAFWENDGAYTGEVSPAMLKNTGVEYVILGHSERRKYQKESDEMIEKKLRAVSAAGLTPILCVDKISQLENSIKKIKNWKTKIKNLVVAYEPIFAIGTGKACNPEIAHKMRVDIERIVGVKTQILYGGSVNSKNAKNYIDNAGFQGLLVGGASLNPKEFIDIVKNITK